MPESNDVYTGQLSYSPLVVAPSSPSSQQTPVADDADSRCLYDDFQRKCSVTGSDDRKENSSKSKTAIANVFGNHVSLASTSGIKLECNSSALANHQNVLPTKQSPSKRTSIVLRESAFVRRMTAAASALKQEKPCNITLTNNPGCSRIKTEPLTPTKKIKVEPHSPATFKCVIDQPLSQKYSRARKRKMGKMVTDVITRVTLNTYVETPADSNRNRVRDKRKDAGVAGGGGSGKSISRHVTSSSKSNQGSESHRKGPAASSAGATGAMDCSKTKANG